MEAFDGLGISIILTCNPAIQVFSLCRIFIQYLLENIHHVCYAIPLSFLFIYKE
jgi:hypothetical protein